MIMKKKFNFYSLTLSLRSGQEMRGREIGDDMQQRPQARLELGTLQLHG